MLLKAPLTVIDVTRGKNKRNRQNSYKNMFVQ